MANDQTLQDQLAAKTSQVDDIVHQISTIQLSINKLSQKFNCESVKLQQKINKVQFSVPRGNPSNQWPHCPMSSRTRAFHQIKDRKERDLRNKKDFIKQEYDHDSLV